MNETTNKTIIIKNYLENSDNILKQINDLNFINENYLISKQNNSIENQRNSNFIKNLNEECDKKIIFVIFVKNFFIQKIN